MNPVPIIQLMSIGATFRDGRGFTEVLHDINLSVMPGEIVVVTGRTGSGKTTLLQIAGSVLLPSQGKVLFEGKAVSPLESSRARHRRRHVGFVLSEDNLLANFKVIENVALQLELDGLSPAKAHIKAYEALSTLEVDRLSPLRAKNLSASEAQLVALARASVGEKRIILIDEPFAKLTPADAERFIAALRKLTAAGAACLLTTDYTNSWDWADRVFHLDKGHLSAVSQTTPPTSTVPTSSVPAAAPPQPPRLETKPDGSLANRESSLGE